mgnify:CR=1 FL=1
MSVTNTPRKAGPYTGNNVSVQYVFSFKVFADTDLVATRAVIATGVESTLVLTTDYSVTRNADQDVDPGGYITLTAALADTYTLTLTSAVPGTQPAVFTNLGGFYPAVLNNALDRLTILVQQLKETVGRSLKLAVSTPSGFDATLPAPVPYGVVGFNGTGTGFAVTDPSGSSALAGDLASPDAGKGAALVGFAGGTVDRKLKESRSAYDFGARGASTATDTAAINAGIAALHAAGGGYLIINEFVSTSIDLTTLANQTDVVLVDRRFVSAGHAVHFATGGDVEQRIHGTSVAGGEGPSFVAVNTATTGDRTASLVARYGTGAGSSVNSYVHFGVWDGSAWTPDIDYILNGNFGGAANFRSRLRVGAKGAVIVNPGGTGKSIDAAAAYAAGYSLVVNRPAQDGGGYQFGVKNGAVEVPQELQVTGTNAAIRLQNAAGANRFSLISDFPSTGQFQIYDNVAGTALMTFTSGGALALNMKGMSVIAAAAAGVPTDTLFKDSADGKLKFKDAGGTVNALY